MIREDLPFDNFFNVEGAGGPGINHVATGAKATTEVIPRFFKKRGYVLEMVGTMPAKQFCGMYTGQYLACTLADYNLGYTEQDQKHTFKLVKGTCNGPTCQICGISHDWKNPGVVEKKALELADMLNSTFDAYKAKGRDIRYYNRKNHKYEKYVELVISEPERLYKNFDTLTGYNHMNRDIKRYGEYIGLVGGVRFAVHAVRDGDGRKNEVMEKYRRGEVELKEGYHHHQVGFLPTIRLKSDDFNLLTSQGIQAIYGAKLLVQVAAMSRADQKARIEELERLHPSLCEKGCDNRKTGFTYKLIPQSGWSRDKRDLKKKLAYEMDHSFLPARDIISRRKRKNQIVYEGMEPEYLEYEVHQHGHLYDPVGICHQSNLERHEEPDGELECKCEGCTGKYVYHYNHMFDQPFDKPGERGDPVEKTKLVYLLKPGRFEVMLERYKLRAL